jgi:hypothetical protein
VSTTPATVALVSPPASVVLPGPPQVDPAGDCGEGSAWSTVCGISGDAREDGEPAPLAVVVAAWLAIWGIFEDVREGGEPVLRANWDISEDVREDGQSVLLLGPASQHRRQKDVQTPVSV